MLEKTILLVEDNRDDEALALRSLKKHCASATVDVARDGAEAVDYLLGNGTRDLPVLVLLDLKLPKLSGLEVLRRIRADNRTRFLPVIVLTSSNERQDILQAYDFGANSYIRKAVDYDHFNRAVAHLCAYWLNLNEPAPH